MTRSKRTKTKNNRLLVSADDLTVSKSQSKSIKILREEKKTSFSPDFFFHFVVIFFLFYELVVVRELQHNGLLFSLKTMKTVNYIQKEERTKKKKKKKKRNTAQLYYRLC